ncbi:hypothetical protein RCCS2_02288 [Roseobacter sp. CCS2]|nr:hypothetical protein RCCS2_02288 [Roseobacter sp. CCS2]
MLFKRINQFLGPNETVLCGLLGAFIILSMGYLVSSLTYDADWSARFGCLCVVYGLLLLVLMRWRFGDLQPNDKVFEATIKKAALPPSPTKQFTDQINSYGEHVRSKSVFLTEVSVIGIGTLQWGFGDLVASRLVICGAWTC